MIVASIDIGTNTVLLLIAEADPAALQLKTLLNEYRIPRIGKGLLQGNPISKEKILELIKILDEYKNIAYKFNCERIIATATHAFRIASNGSEIISLVKEKLGIEIKIISGEDEARYSFLGVSSITNKNEKILAIDIGGGSTEIVFGENNTLLLNQSFKIGAVNSTEKYLNDYSKNREGIFNLIKEIEIVFEKISGMNLKPDKAVAIAGTPTTLACIKLGLNYFDEDKIEGMILTYQELDELVKELSHLSAEEILVKYKSVVKGREDVLLAGSLILLRLMKLLKLDRITVSTKGIRYGAIVNSFIA